MGLLDSIAGNVLGSVLGGNKSAAGGVDLASVLGSVMSGGQGQADMASAVGGLLNQAGGLGGLMQKAQEVGLGDKVGSWIGTGENQPISGEQAQDLLGNAGLKDVAAKAGIDLSSAGPLIAMLLPILIDKLTPKGQVEAGHQSGPGLESAIGGLMSGGGMQDILGAVLKQSMGGGGGGLAGVLGGLLGGNKA
jgi:uncharacterized protein YidB (DUF937 family)